MEIIDTNIGGIDQYKVVSTSRGIFASGGINTKDEELLLKIYRLDQNANNWDVLYTDQKTYSLIGHGMVFYSDSIYIIFGEDVLRENNNLIRKYTFKDDQITCETLENSGKFPSGRSYFGCTLHGTSIIIYGGKSRNVKNINNYDFNNDLWIYNIETNSWSDVNITSSFTNPPYLIYPEILNIHSQHSILILNGFHKVKQNRDVYLYNLDTDQFQSVAFPIPESAIFSSCIISEYIAVPEVGKKGAAKPKPKPPAKGQKGISENSVDMTKMIFANTNEIIYMYHHDPAEKIAHISRLPLTTLAYTNVYTDIQLPLLISPFINFIDQSIPTLYLYGYDQIYKLSLILSKVIVEETKVEEKLIYGMCDDSNEDFYEGNWKNNKRHGHGKCIYKNGDIYNGNWIENRRHGEGLCTYLNQESYEGTWKNDTYEGKGTYKYTQGGPFGYHDKEYSGNFITNVRIGSGTCLYENGDFYKGSWTNNQRHGKGRMEYAINNTEIKDDFTSSFKKYLHDIQDDLIYEGDFLYDKREGRGKCTSKYKDEYIGEYHNNVKSGDGKMTYANGDQYVGHFENNYRNGNGRCVYSNGDWYTGNWIKDTCEGYGEYHYKNGDLYSGNFKNNKPNGKGELLVHNGDKYIGFFKDGQFHKSGTFISSSLEYEGQFYYGVREGEGELRLFDNKHFIYEHYFGTFKENIRCGEGKCDFRKAGNKFMDKCGTYIGSFDKDKRNGKGTMTYQNGSIYEGDWVGGERSGKGHHYQMNTNIVEYTGDYIHNQRHGYGEGKYEDQSIYKGQYMNDKRNGEGECGYTNGDKYTGFWNNDLRHGFGTLVKSNGEVYSGQWTNDLQHIIDEEWSGILSEEQSELLHSQMISKYK